jgi:hypothetical protein
MGEKLRVDLTEFTLGEMAEATEAAGDPAAAGFNFRQTAALAWIAQRHLDPSFTFEQALAFKIGDLDIVDHSGEVPAAANGGMPLRSLDSGTLTPSA